MRELRLVLLSLAALIAMTLGVGFLKRAFLSPPLRQDVGATPQVPPAAPPPEPASAEDRASRAAVERAIADAPDYARFFDRLKLVFPSDYETIVTRVARLDGRGRDVDPDKVMLDSTAELRRLRGSLMAKAPDEILDQYVAAETRELQAIGRQDTHLCVVFAAGGEAPGFLGFAAEHRPLVATAAIAALDAMNSGRMSQSPRALPSDADLQALERALVEAGLTRPEIAALLDDTPPTRPIADDDMCKAQQTYMTTIGAMPSDVRSRFYGVWADVMAKS